MRFLKGLFSSRKPEKKSLPGSFTNVVGNPGIHDLIMGLLQNPYIKSMWISTCVDMNSSKVSDIIHNAQLKKRSDKSVIDENDIYDVFFENPNENEDSYQLYGFLMHQFYETGNAYMRLIGNPPGTILAVEPFFSNSVEPVEGNMSAGEPRIKGYKIYDGTKDKDFVSAEEMIHVKNYNSWNRISGVSTYEPLRKEIKIEESIALWMLKNYNEDSFPNLVVNFGEGFDVNDQEIRENFKKYNKETMAGPGGSRVMAITGGQDVKVLTNSPADMKLVESENAIAAKIATYFGIPAELLGPISKQTKTLNNYRVARKQWISDKIFSLSSMFVRAINRKVYKGTDMYLDLDRKTIEELQPDAEEIEKMNYLTTNEKRAYRNRPKYKGKNADKILVQGTMMVLEELGMEPEEQEVQVTL